MVTGEGRLKKYVDGDRRRGGMEPVKKNGDGDGRGGIEPLKAAELSRDISHGLSTVLYYYFEETFKNIIRSYVKC